jgi:hypothetical protein
MKLVPQGPQMSAPTLGVVEKPLVETDIKPQAKVPEEKKS